MEVKLVCRRKQPCLRVVSNWVVDKVKNQKDLTEQDLPTSQEKREKREARGRVAGEHARPG